MVYYLELPSLVYCDPIEQRVIDTIAFKTVREPMQIPGMSKELMVRLFSMNSRVKS